MSEPKHDMARKGCQPFDSTSLYDTILHINVVMRSRTAALIMKGLQNQTALYWIDIVLYSTGIVNTWDLILQCKFAMLKHMTMPIARQLMHARRL